MDASRGRIVLKNLFNVAAFQNDLPWKPFREGVEIFSLYGDPATEPSAALLRYAPGAGVPSHRHSGYEHIMVLSQSQTDESGTYEAGTLIVNPAGSQHSVTNQMGCIVLVIWHSPVVFNPE